MLRGRWLRVIPSTSVADDFHVVATNEDLQYSESLPVRVVPRDGQSRDLSVGCRLFHNSGVAPAGHPQQRNRISVATNGRNFAETTASAGGDYWTDVDVVLGIKPHCMEPTRIGGVKSGTVPSLAVPRLTKLA